MTCYLHKYPGPGAVTHSQHHCRLAGGAQGQTGLRTVVTEMTVGLN